MTDGEGRFRFVVPTPHESFYIYAHPAAYRSYLDGPFWVGEGDTLRIDYRVQALPIPLDPISVTVERRQARLNLSGFYIRQSHGSGGVFLGPKELEEKRAVRGTDFLRGITGVHVVPHPRGLGKVLVVLRNRCLPTLFVDGIRVRSQDSGGAGIDDVVSPEEVEGIEIYRSPAEVPLQFGGTGASCGVIAIWTH